MDKTGSTERFRNIHEGSKCFVLGAGTSLTNLDLTGIHQYPVICVNSSIILMPWNEPGDPLRRLWLSTDVLVMQWDYFWSKVVKFECTRIVRNSWSRMADRIKQVHVDYFIPRRTGGYKEPDWSECGLIGSSSILGSIDLSILMGCKKIFLLGVDHRMTGGHSHFWQLLPKEEWPQREGKPSNFSPCQRQQSRVFKSNFKTFDLLDKYAKGRNAQIFNCSPISEVASFEKMSLEDAIRG